MKLLCILPLTSGSRQYSSQVKFSPYLFLILKKNIFPRTDILSADGLLPNTLIPTRQKYNPFPELAEKNISSAFQPTIVGESEREGVKLQALFYAPGMQ